MKNKWKSKYVKLIQKEIPDIFQHLKINPEDLWCIAEEYLPGEWKLIYLAHELLDIMSPFPITPHRVPNLAEFSYQELTKKQVERILFVDGI